MQKYEVSFWGGVIMSKLHFMSGEIAAGFIFLILASVLLILSLVALSKES